MAAAATIAFVVLSALTRSVPAVGTLPVRVEWDAPAGCSDPEAFFDSMQARFERARRAEAADDAAARVEVHLSRSSGGNKVHGELRLFEGGVKGEPSGRSDVRKVDGATCEEVAEALSLTAALALGASMAPRTTGTASSGTPSGALALPSSAPVLASPGGSSSTAATIPSAAAAPVPPPNPRLAASESPSPSKTEPAPVPEAAPRERPAAAAELVYAAPVAGSLGFEVGIGPVVGQVVSPTFDLGASLTGRAALRSLPARLDRSLALSVTHLRNNLLGASPDVVVTWTALALTVCPGWGLGGRVVIEGCGTAAGGRLQAAEHAVTVPRSVTRLWWSAGPVLRVRLALGLGLVLQVDAGAHIPIARRNFVTTTPDETVAKTPAVAGMVGLIIAREL